MQARHRPTTHARAHALGALVLVSGLGLGAVGHAPSAVSAQSGPAAPPPAARNEVPDCVEVRAESRQNGIGWSHVVIVTNRCTSAVRCALATDVDPEPTYPLIVGPNETGEVSTRLTSPAPAVTAIARCTLERGGRPAPRGRPGGSLLGPTR
jgi:hypothetical protein